MSIGCVLGMDFFERVPKDPRETLGTFPIVEYFSPSLSMYYRITPLKLLFFLISIFDKRDKNTSTKLTLDLNTYLILKILVL